MRNTNYAGQLPGLPDDAGSPMLRDEVMDSLDMYLKRGERLTTLAKEHFQQRMHKKMPTAEAAIYDMSLDQIKYSPRECMIKLRNIVGGYLRSIQEDGDESCKSIGDLTGGRVSIHIRKDLAGLKGRLGGDEEDVVIEVNILKENGTHKFCCLKNKPDGLTGKSHVRIYAGDILVEDVRNTIGYLILYSELEKAVRDDELSKILFREVREKHHNRESTFRSLFGLLCSRAWCVFEEAFACEIKDQATLRSTLCQEIRRYLASGGVLKAAMSDKALFSDMLIKCLRQYGVAATVSPEDERSLFQESILQLKEHFVDRVPDLRKEAQDVLSHMVIPLFDQPADKEIVHIFWTDYVLEGQLPGFDDTFFAESVFGRSRRIKKEHFRTCCGRPGVWYWDRWLFKLFKVVYTHRHEALVQWQEYKESVSAYARSYMNKARLPQKTLQAMQTSLLNDFFGFVEYDEDVDLEKAAEVEKMFLAVRETYLKRFDASKNAIRFRKLGNHNATGLYYPGVKCLCVDYRHPSSFMHEFGHLIDYECGCLSLEDGFYRIKCLYREWVSLHEGQLNRRSKYNMQYYLKPTEIFARSFEIYCRKVLKIENDLLPDEFTEAVYPSSEIFVTEVTAYFNALLERKAA